MNPNGATSTWKGGEMEERQLIRARNNKTKGLAICEDQTVHAAPNAPLNAVPKCGQQPVCRKFKQN